MKRILMVLTLALAACGGGGGAVVVVNGQPITKEQFDARLEANMQVAPPVLEGLVQYALIDQYAEKNHVVIPDSEIDKTLNDYKTRLDGQWDQFLKQQGMTETDLRNLIRRQKVIDKAVGANITITEKQIDDYFKKNSAQFNIAASARVRIIQVPDVATAQKVEADLKAGKDFASEAKQYSMDTSKSNGGELGWIGKGRMIGPPDQYIFSAPVGQISPPLKSFFGYYIIQVEQRKPATKATLASAHDEVAQLLRGQEESPLIPGFLQQQQQSAKIQVNDPRFAQLFATPPPFSPNPLPVTTPTKK